MRCYTDWEKIPERVTFVRNKTLSFFLIDNWETPNACEQRKDTVNDRHQEVNGGHNKSNGEE